ncbi:galectin-4-like isoform X2 [Aricia agestis]|uniref:galectin-4-like isoform X2 n=1 Tax=Aricia agestis TaxID=91739 RepID=UPI001C207C85|nr:galectin-4-like isoform X2 [Aricia agestis]XP_041988316.1 galectin-4-like isoform X2 [Aricia agestis]
MVCGSCALCERLFCRPAPKVVEENVQLAESLEVRFTQALEEPLGIGSHIVCTGTPSADLPWFSINLCCGEEGSEGGEEGDVAVHFNVRVPQQYVVRNTRRRARWGPEETTAYRLFPFKVDRPFTLEILVDEKETLWAVDGAHYCSYAHRTPSVFAARAVRVSGVRDATLNVRKCDAYPMLASPPPEVPLRSSVSEVGMAGEGADGAEGAWRANIIATLPDGVPDGHQLVVEGRIRGLLHSITLDLLDEAREWPRPQLVLHAAVRAYDRPQLAAQLVVLNAWLGAWGTERRQRTARLVPGQVVTLRVMRTAEGWSLYCDDALLGEMEARAALQPRAVRLRGDLTPTRLVVTPAPDVGGPTTPVTPT